VLAAYPQISEAMGLAIVSALLGEKPVVANHLNVPKPSEGKPTLLTWDEVTTAFHEFGHALHGMFSNVTYPRFAGTNVPRDFVEYPSQVNEMWADWPSVLANYAKHHETGAPMPKELLDKVLASSKFNQGFTTTEYLGAAMLDQNWHQLTPDNVPAADGVMAFEADALKKDGVDFAPVPPRYRTPYRSIMFLMPIAIAFAFTGLLDQVITFSILSGLLGYTFMSFNITKFRRQWPLGSIVRGYEHPFHPLPAIVLLLLCAVTYFAVFLGYGTQLVAMMVFYIAASAWFAFHRYKYVRRGDQFTMPWPRPAGY